MDLNATIIGQSIAFFVFVWFCMKYVWPPIVGALNERQEKIAGGLASSERAEKDLELAQERVSEMLREAKANSASIIEQANKRANQIVEEAKDQARDEGQRMISGARAEIDQEMNRAKEQLRAQVASIALMGAEKVLETSIDEKAHNDLAEKLAQSL